MTGRDRVKAALTFPHPDRAPRDLWMNPYISLFMREELDEVLRRFPLDVVTVGARAPRPGDEYPSDKYRPAGTYSDEWGSVWHVGEPGVIGEVKQPVFEDWCGLRAFQPPWACSIGT